LSRHLVHLLFSAVIAALTVLACRAQLRSGVATLQGWSAEATRAGQPVRYWLYLSSWAVIAGAAIFATVRSGLRHVSDPEPVAATGADWLPLLVIAAVFLLLLGLRKLYRLWRRGNPLRHWKDLRRERELRRLMRALASDPDERFDGESIDEFAAFADLEWLEDIVVHMSLQSEPRRFALAALETDTPLDGEAAAPSTE
jgi:hypothetical protein